MPTFRITSPEGKTFDVNAPEGATREEALAYAQQQSSPKETYGEDGKKIAIIPNESTFADTSPKANSFEDTLRQELQDRPTEAALAAFGSPVRNAYQGTKQLLGMGDREAINAGNIIDSESPVSAFAGNALAFAPTTMIPGANTYTGAAIIGGGLGLLQPTMDDNVVRGKVTNTAYGVGGGLFGKKIGDVLGKVLARRNARIETAKPVMEARSGQIADFQNEGYVIPPADVDAGFGSKVLNALSGQAKTQQKASSINQPVTNKLVARDLGLDPEQPITREAIAGVRKKAGQAYEVIRGTGRVEADAQYKTALAELNKANENAVKDFPELANTELQDLVKAANKDGFDASSAVDAIGIFRDKADSFYASGDKKLGAATKKIADEMEAMLGRHLVKTGTPDDVLANFQGARKLIAKTYTADKALNSSTGNISAQKLGKEVGKGRPLEGGMRKAGEFAQSFNKSAQEITNTNPYTIADAFVGGIGGMYTGGAMTAAVAARPVARSLILNPAYQKAFVNPQMPGPSLGVLLEGAERSAIPLSTLSAIGLAPEVEQQ
jgi:hypothetical protein